MGGSAMPHSPTQRSDGSGGSGGVAGMEPQKGVVTILDIARVFKADRDEKEVNVADKIDGVVAHFIAHNKVETAANSL